MAQRLGTPYPERSALRWRGVLKAPRVLESEFCYWMWPWASDVTSLHLWFNICRVGIKIFTLEDFIKTKNKQYCKSTILLLLSCSVVSDSLTPWTVAIQAPLCMGFSRQEYWSGLPFPSPGNFPDPEIQPRCPAWQADSFIIWAYYNPI